MWAAMRDADSIANGSKRKGRHPDKALSAVRVRALKEPGRYADGNGLYLIVDQSGAKRWILRTVVQGRRPDIGLGGLSSTSLSEAREDAARLRKAARLRAHTAVKKEDLVERQRLYSVWPSASGPRRTSFARRRRNQARVPFVLNSLRRRNTLETKPDSPINDCAGC